MERIEYRNVVDKSDWPRGEWDSEPDKIQWQDEETGLPCLIVRQHNGYLCGYVGVTEGHPWHGGSYDRPDVSVHCGLTFAGPCMTNADEASDICHKTGDGEPDNVWWLGFDCAHAWDAYPLESYKNSKAEYRNVAYVTEECRALARQLHAAKGTGSA